jgi:hypothetical protein
VISWKRRRQLYQQKLDEAREELKQKYAEQAKSMYRNEIDATAANIDRLHAAIKSERAELDEFDAITRDHQSIADRLADKPSRSAEFAYWTEGEGQVKVFVRHDLTDLNVRIVAVNKEGGAVPPRSVGSKSVQARDRDRAKEVATATFEVPADQIRELRLQARPYHWAEFREVVLEPPGGEVSSGGAPPVEKSSRPPRRQDVETSEDVIRAYSQELMERAKSLDDERENLRRAEKELQQADADKRLYTPEDWARVDETMKTHVNMRNELQLRVESLESQLGPAHQAVIRAKEDLAARQLRADEVAHFFNTKYIIRWKEDGTGGVLIPRDLTGLRESVKRLEKQYESASKKVEEMREAARAAKSDEEASARGPRDSAAPAGGDPVLTARRLALLKLEGELREARAQLAEAKREIAAADKRPSAEDFARVDERAKELLHQRDEMRSRRDELEPQLGADSAVVRRLDSNLERAEAQWRDYGAELAKRFYVHWDLGGKGPSLVPRDLAALEVTVERLAHEVEEARKRLETESAR